MNDAHQVDAQHPLPVGDRVLPDQSTRTNAGIVEDEVRRPEALLNCHGQRLHLRRIRHIDLARQHLDTSGFHLDLGRVQRVLLHIDQHQVHAACSADAGAFEAEARTGTSENGGFVFEILNHEMQSLSCV